MCIHLSESMWSLFSVSAPFLKPKTARDVHFYHSVLHGAKTAVILLDSGLSPRVAIPVISAAPKQSIGSQADIYVSILTGGVYHAVNVCTPDFFRLSEKRRPDGPRRDSNTGYTFVGEMSEIFPVRSPSFPGNNT